jgi:hypothetical protein
VQLVYLQLLPILHRDLQMKEILGLTPQLEKFMFITIATGLSQHLAILDQLAQQVRLVHKVLQVQ